MPDAVDRYRKMLTKAQSIEIAGLQMAPDTYARLRRLLEQQLDDAQAAGADEKSTVLAELIEVLDDTDREGEK